MEELNNFRKAYRDVVDDEAGEKDVRVEVRRRVGMRVRELENAVEAMEKGVIEEGG